jgi:hypothetical protein
LAVRDAGLATDHSAGIMGGVPNNLGDKEMQFFYGAVKAK